MTSKAIQCDIFCDNSRKRFPFFRLPRKKISFFQTPFSDFRSGCPKKPSSWNGKLGPFDFILFKRKTWPACISRQFCVFCRRTIDKVNIELQRRRRGRNYSHFGFLLGPNFGTYRNMSVNMFPMRLCHFFAFCFLVLVTAEARQTSFPQVMIGKRMFPIFLIIKKNCINVWLIAGKVSAEEMCFDFKIETCHRWLFWNGIVSLFLLSISYRALFRLPDVFCPPWWGIWRGDNINVIIKVTISSLFANTMMIMVIKDFQPLGNPSKTT